MVRKTSFYSKLLQVLVFTLTILTANLLSDFTSNFLTSFKGTYKPLVFSIMAMAIIVIIFYPVFILLEKWISKLSTTIVKSGRSLLGKYTWLMLSFFVSMLVLIWFYVKIWYDIDSFDFIIQGKTDFLF
jgi:hypothetical protein